MADSTNKSLACVLCSSKFDSKDALQKHFRNHAKKSTPNKPGPSLKIIKKETLGCKKSETGTVACDVCGQEFSNNTKAIQHKFRKHPNVLNKYLCPYCGMQFTIRSLFENHLDTHCTDTREKNSISCDECKAEFYFDEAREYHFKTTHNRVKTLFQPIPTPPPSKKIKINNAGDVQSVYYCHLCGSEYVLKFNLQEHLKKVHSELERCTMPSDLIRCTTCDALFYNTKAYDTHNIGHKPGDLYVGSEEQRLKMVSRVDQDFDIRRVLPVANKYIPSFKKRSNKSLKTNFKKRLDANDDDLSPPSTPESTDSDSDSNIPLAKLKEKTENKTSEDPIFE